MPTKAILFFFDCSEVNSTWLITSELANQRARKVIFTCVVYTNYYYYYYHYYYKLDSTLNITISFDGNVVAPLYAILVINTSII